MIKSIALVTYKQPGLEGRSIPVKLSNEIKHWFFVMSLPVIGLLALTFFLSLGGTFAICGSLAIFVVVKLLNKHRVDKAYRKLLNARKDAPC
jgi:hypothetical protein